VSIGCSTTQRGWPTAEESGNLKRSTAVPSAYICNRVAAGREEIHRANPGS
jgi:hypothetical protein